MDSRQLEVSWCFPLNQARAPAACSLGFLRHADARCVRCRGATPDPPVGRRRRQGL